MAASAPTLSARIHANGPELQFTVLADPPQVADGLLRVRAIEIRRGDSAQATQRIEGLATATPWSASAPGLEFVDLNFDGYADMRLVEAQPAGPNVPYLNWLYEPGTGRYVANKALDAISAVTPDAQRKELRSEWRDGPARYGVDTYIWRDGQPVLVRKEARDYQRPGAYTLTISRLEGGTWRVVEKRKVNE